MKKLLSMILVVAMLTVGACGLAEGYTFADTVDWQGRYDVVIVGFGGAGAIAARTAADEGAKVLIVEKAPEGHEGGNTRYCGQLFVYGNENEENTLKYYKALGGKNAVPEEMLKVYTREIAHLAGTLAEMFNVDQADFVDSNDAGAYNMSPEYPELPGSESINLRALHNGISDGYLWNLMRGEVVNRTSSIDVWFESPAIHLIQDPESKTIMGVQVERAGETLNIRADNGVILACGGFENNREMIETYLGLAESAPVGSAYNTGDGVRMAQEIGADMWHMHVYEGIVNTGATSKVVAEGERAGIVANPALSSGSAIMISGAGTRFLNEGETLRHGHLKNGDVYVNPSYPQNFYVLMDEKQYQVALESDANLGTYGFLDGYEHTTVGKLDEIAQALGMDYDTLKTTVDNFNFFVESGVDYQFGRSIEKMETIDTESTFYAVRLIPNILNTQGGPRHNENAEVLDTMGNPIPNLYSCGELGGICSLQYQGGGNIAECIIFGRIAGRNAAAEKEPLSDYESLQKIDANIIYTPGVMSDLVKTGDVQLAQNEYYAEGTGMGGKLGVIVAMDGERIAEVRIVLQNETAGIGTPAIEKIPAMIVDSQSTDIDVVTGATITSNAIIEAVNNALSGK